MPSDVEDADGRLRVSQSQRGGSERGIFFPLSQRGLARLEELCGLLHECK